jgi:hypothetical protein
MLTRLAARNFKLFGDVDIELGERVVFNLSQVMWHRREIENYLCQRPTLIRFAQEKGKIHQGDLFAASWGRWMEESIDEIAEALAALGKPDPWSSDLKVSEDFLDPLFRRFYSKLGIPDLMRKTDYHTLAPFVAPNELDREVIEKLDAIAEVVARARPRGRHG